MLLKLPKAIITFSFDDARSDTYYAIKKAIGNNVACTLNVTTGYVDGTLSEEYWPTSIPPMSEAELFELKKMGAEIAGHGDKHNNEFESLISGREKIKNWFEISEDTLIGLASPHSKFIVNPENTDFIRNNFKYCRVGGYINGLNKKKRIIQKMARITGSNYLYKYVYGDTVKNTASAFPIIRSVPVLKDNTVEQIKAIINLSIENRYWCILCFHSILKEGQQEYNSNFTWDDERYAELVKWVGQNNDIEKMTTLDVVERYFDK